MTKYIKRAGIVFFAIVLSLLLFIGIILTLNATNSNEDYSDLKNDYIQTIADKSYDLFRGAETTIWNEAIAYSVDNERIVEVNLVSNWTYVADSGVGFSPTGGMYVPAKAYVRLNLNGYSIIGTAMNELFFIEGHLEISSSTINDFENEILTGNITGSKITGFQLQNNSPLIYLSGTDAYFSLNYVAITGNKANIISSDDYGFIKAVSGTCKLYSAGFCNNSVTGSISNRYIYSAVNGSCDINGAVIVERKANMSGINCDLGNINMRDGYIYGNNKYDIRLGSGKIMFKSSMRQSSMFGISVAPGRIFTGNYGDYHNINYNPARYFKFNDTLSTSDYAPLVNSSGEVEFLPRSQMKLIEKPTSGTNSEYIMEFGSKYYPVGFNSTTMLISGNTTPVGPYGVGIYTAYVEPRNGYLWKENGEYEQVSFVFQIVPKKLEKPTLETNTYVYDGQVKSITLQNYDTSLMTITGTESATNVGSYTIRISLKDKNNYNWQNGSTASTALGWNITEKPIEKPVTGENIFIFNNSAYEYEPEGFESSQMTISDNIQTNVGKYTAKVKPDSNHKWSDDTKTEIEFEYVIVPPGIVLEYNINWDYLYLQNNFRKSYSANYIHKLNDSNIALANGKTRYVIGNILLGTNISTFLGNIRNEINLIKIYNQYGNIIYDGIASNGEITDSVGKQVIGTGYRVELYASSTATTPLDNVYLSVLGDLNGDGRITAMDLLVINQMAKDDNMLNTMEVEYQLAAMVNNKGGITSVDSEILNNVMSGELDLNLFINAEINENTNYTYLTLNKEDGKYNRVVSNTATNVIGNISIGTKVSEFKSKLATLGVNTAQIAIYNNQNTQVTDDNAVVGTGWYYKINGGQKTYISVLGDLNGDGRISASDMMYLNQIINGDKESFEDCIILSAIILNTGKITSADVEVLRDNIENFTALIAY